jgi:hypothetical protein
MSRKNKRRQGRKSFVLIVDGETESWYIEQLKEQEKDILVGLNLKPDLRHKKKLEDLYELIKELVEKGYEKIFWIVDFDTIIKETKETKKGKQRELDKFINYYKKLSRNEKIIIIINNPCFEYWFLQHFDKVSKYFNNYEELKKELKKHIKDYNKTREFYYNCNCRKGIYSLLKPKLKTAISYSKEFENFTFDETDVKNYESGQAEMYKLFEELKIK